MNYRIWILISLIVGSCQLEGEDNGQLYSTLNNTLECWKDVAIPYAQGYSIDTDGENIYVGGNKYSQNSNTFQKSNLYSFNNCGSKILDLGIFDDNETSLAATFSYIKDFTIDNNNFIILKYSSAAINNVKKMDSEGNIQWEDNIPYSVEPFLVKNDSDNFFTFSDAQGNYGDNTEDNSTWGAFDILVKKYNQSGKVWSYQIGSQTSVGNLNEGVNGADLDQNGNIYVLGTTNSDFSGLTFKTDDTDIIVFKLDSNGNQLWKKQFGTGSTDNPLLVKFNENVNEVWIFASSSGDLDNDSNTSTSMVFLIKIDTNGNEISREAVFNGDNLSPKAIFPGVNQDYYIIGDINENLFYQNDIFIKNISKTGKNQWTKILNLETIDYARAGKVISNKIYIVGSVGEDLVVKRFDLNGNSDTN